MTEAGGEDDQGEHAGANPHGGQLIVDRAIPSPSPQETANAPRQGQQGKSKGKGEEPIAQADRRGPTWALGADEPVQSQETGSDQEQDGADRQILAGEVLD